LAHLLEGNHPAPVLEELRKRDAVSIQNPGGQGRPVVLERPEIGEVAQERQVEANGCRACSQDRQNDPAEEQSHRSGPTKSHEISDTWRTVAESPPTALTNRQPRRIT